MPNEFRGTMTLNELHARCCAVAAQAARLEALLAADVLVDHDDLLRRIDDLEHDYQTVIAALRELAGQCITGAESPMGDSAQDIKTFDAIQRINETFDPGGSATQ